MSRELIKNYNGQTIAIIDTDGQGIMTLKTYSGTILGTYNPKRNITQNYSGTILSQGNSLGMLIKDPFQEQKNRNKFNENARDEDRNRRTEDSRKIKSDDTVKKQYHSNIPGTSTPCSSLLIREAFVGTIIAFKKIGRDARDAIFFKDGWLGFFRRISAPAVICLIWFGLRFLVKNYFENVNNINGDGEIMFNCALWLCVFSLMYYARAGGKEEEKIESEYNKSEEFEKARDKVLKTLKNKRNRELRKAGRYTALTSIEDSQMWLEAGDLVRASQKQKNKSK